MRQQFTPAAPSAEIIVTRDQQFRPALPFPPNMNCRPVVHPRPASEPLSNDTARETSPAADGPQKTWHVDEPSGLPVPVIRANMISFRRSYQGRVKVTFFEQE